MKKILLIEDPVWKKYFQKLIRGLFKRFTSKGMSMCTNNQIYPPLQKVLTLSKKAICINSVTHFSECTITSHGLKKLMKIPPQNKKVA